MATAVKVVDVDRCNECNDPLPALALGAICRKCLMRRSRNMMLVREREAWDRERPKDIALSRVKGKPTHLVLSKETNYTYCGQRATELKKRRHRVKPDDLPPGMCTDCRAAFDHLVSVYLLVLGKEQGAAR